jgi:hypothetical protein
VGVLVVDALQCSDGYYAPLADAFKGKQLPEPPAFILVLSVFETYGDRRGVSMWPLHVAIAVGAEGSFLAHRWIFPGVPPSVKDWIEGYPPPWAVAKEMYWVIAPVLEAHRILSCRNVTTRPKEPMPRKQAEATKTLKPAGVTFKVIVVGDRIVREGSKSGAPLDDETYVPLHVVRGHMVRYTAARPLFGKFVGNFYRKPHTRGTKEAGEVKKTYQVGEPEGNIQFDLDKGAPGNPFLTGEDTPC